MELVLHPNEMLHKKVKPFDFNEHDAKEIQSKMIKVMRRHHGVGISANQVGLDASVFIIKNCAMFNPEITQYSEEKETKPEGCLSFPREFIDVERSTTISVKYQNADGKVITGVLEGHNARVFQHEFDHLNGVLFNDK